MEIRHLGTPVPEKSDTIPADYRPEIAKVYEKITLRRENDVIRYELQNGRASASKITGLCMQKPQQDHGDDRTEVFAIQNSYTLVSFLSDR